MNIPYIDSVTVEPSPGETFILFDNETDPATIKIDPLNDENNIQVYTVTIVVDDGRGGVKSVTFKVEI